MAELSRLILGAHKLNTTEMLQEDARHVKLLHAQVGMLSLLRTIAEGEGAGHGAGADARAAGVCLCGGVQELLAAEGKCLIPRQLVDVVAKDTAIKSNALVNRDLTRFMEALVIPSRARAPSVPRQGSFCGQHLQRRASAATERRGSRCGQGKAGRR